MPRLPWVGGPQAQGPRGLQAVEVPRVWRENSLCQDSLQTPQASARRQRESVPRVREDLHPGPVHAAPRQQGKEGCRSLANQDISARLRGQGGDEVWGVWREGPQQGGCVRGVCGRDQAQYTRQVDNNFPIPTSEQDYNFLLYTETALSITDDVNVLRLPFLNQDQKLFEDNQTVTEGFVDSSMFDKNFLVEDIQNTETFNNSRINQVSENTQRELSTSVNHHQIDGTVIRFCKSS